MQSHCFIEGAMRKAQTSKTSKCRESGKASKTDLCKIKGGGTAARKNPVCTLGCDGTRFFCPCCAVPTSLIRWQNWRAAYDG
jgi:hypothetical protein